MYVKLTTATGGVVRLMAIIRVVEGNIQIEEKEPVPPNIRRDIEYARQLVKGGDEAYLRALEIELSGSYYRAQFIKD